MYSSNIKLTFYIQAMENFSPKNILEEIPTGTLELDSVFLIENLKKPIHIKYFINDFQKIFGIINEIKGDKTIDSKSKLEFFTRKLYSEKRVEDLDYNRVFTISILQELLRHQGKYKNMKININGYTFIIDEETKTEALLNGYFGNEH